MFVASPTTFLLPATITLVRLFGSSNRERVPPEERGKSSKIEFHIQFGFSDIISFLLPATITLVRLFGSSNWECVPPEERGKSPKIEFHIQFGFSDIIFFALASALTSPPQVQHVEVLQPKYTFSFLLWKEANLCKVLSSFWQNLLHRASALEGNPRETPSCCGDLSVGSSSSSGNNLSLCSSSSSGSILIYSSSSLGDKLIDSCSSLGNNQIHSSSSLGNNLVDLLFSFDCRGEGRGPTLPNKEEEEDDDDDDETQSSLVDLGLGSVIFFSEILNSWPEGLFLFFFKTGWDFSSSISIIISSEDLLLPELFNTLIIPADILASDMFFLVQLLLIFSSMASGRFHCLPDTCSYFSIYLLGVKFSHWDAAHQPHRENRIRVRISV